MVVRLWRLQVWFVSGVLTMMGDTVGWALVQMSFRLRQFTHWSRMKHIANGRDWHFYEQYTLREILRMKWDGTEEDKYAMWCRHSR